MWKCKEKGEEGLGKENTYAHKLLHLALLEALLQLAVLGLCESVGVIACQSVVFCIVAVSRERERNCTRPL